jgi:hypothetical protein
MRLTSSEYSQPLSHHKSPPVSTERSSFEEEEQEEEEEEEGTPATRVQAKMLSQRSPARSPPPRAPKREDDGNNSAGLSVPVSFGMWKEFNYTSRAMSTRMLIRLILHNGVGTNDIQFEWIDSRKLKLMVAWPEWFQYAEQMATFTTDEDGQLLFPPDHQLTMDTSERNHQLEAEDKRIWDDGFILFQQDMKTDTDPIIELLNVDTPSRNQCVNVLQIFAE